MGKMLPRTIQLVRIPPLPTTASRKTREPFNLATYVSGRRTGQGGDACIPIADWFDHLFAINAELKKNDICADFYAGALDLDEVAIDEACLQLLEKLILVRTLMRKGEAAPTRRNLAASESLIQHLALFLVEVLHLEGVPTPEALVVLIRELLGGTKTDLIHDNLPENQEVRQFAAQILAQMPETGVRSLARMFAVAPSTVSRWLKDPVFQGEISFWRQVLSCPLMPPKSKLKRKKKPVADDSSCAT